MSPPAKSAVPVINKLNSIFINSSFFLYKGTLAFFYLIYLFLFNEILFFNIKLCVY